MGKGDKKSKRGKIILGSFGVRRPHRPKALAPAVTSSTKVEKTKSEKPKAVKHPEAIAELIAEPVKIDAKATDHEVDVEMKSARPKAPKKAIPKPAESHEKSVE